MCVGFRSDGKQARDARKGMLLIRDVFLAFGTHVKVQGKFATSWHPKIYIYIYMPGPLNPVYGLGFRVQGTCSVPPFLNCSMPASPRRSPGNARPFFSEALSRQFARYQRRVNTVTSQDRGSCPDPKPERRPLIEPFSLIGIRVWILILRPLKGGGLFITRSTFM